MSTFTKVLKEYCMIENQADAIRFTKRELRCSQFRKNVFLAKVADELSGKETCTKSYDKIQDDIDALRRAPYQGMGI